MTYLLSSDFVRKAIVYQSEKFVLEWFTFVGNLPRNFAHTFFHIREGELRLIVGTGTLIEQIVQESPSPRRRCIMLDEVTNSRKRHLRYG